MKYPIYALIAIICSLNKLTAQQLYDVPENTQSKVISFENPTGAVNNGGKSNKGAKGQARDIIKAGESRVLLDFQSSGTIQRIWCTVNERSPKMLRSLRIQMFWENASAPAVDVPLGDFFGNGLGQMTPFESSIFSNPEGRSFNCLIPMPFQKAAKIIFINESEKDVELFYDVDLLAQSHQGNVHYFHAYWSRQSTSALKKDFEILPKVTGIGRFLGTNIGVMTNDVYTTTWWGEGEVKMYIDQDKEFPSINGTGTEDYIGTGWGMGTYANQFQGCLVADEIKGFYTFYRYHIPDPIYFYDHIKVTLQQIGGGDLELVRNLVKKNVNLEPVTVASGSGFIKLYEQNPPITIFDAGITDGWVNFYRVDDYSATAYFYLDKPTHELPALPNATSRSKGLE